MEEKEIIKLWFCSRSERKFISMDFDLKRICFVDGKYTDGFNDLYVSLQEAKSNFIKHIEERIASDRLNFAIKRNEMNFYKDRIMEAQEELKWIKNYNEGTKYILEGFYRDDPTLENDEIGHWGIIQAFENEEKANDGLLYFEDYGSADEYRIREERSE